MGRSVDALTSASSIAEFMSFEPNFGIFAFSDTYSPWDGLDLFSRSEILAALEPVPAKRKSDTRKLRFKNLKSCNSSKSLPPPVPEGLASHVNQTASCLRVRKFIFLIKIPNCTIYTFVFTCIYVLFSFLFVS